MFQIFSNLCSGVKYAIYVQKYLVQVEYQYSICCKVRYVEGTNYC